MSLLVPGHTFWACLDAPRPLKPPLPLVGESTQTGPDPQSPPCGGGRGELCLLVMPPGCWVAGELVHAHRWLHSVLWDFHCQAGRSNPAITQSFNSAWVNCWTSTHQAHPLTSLFSVKTASIDFFFQWLGLLSAPIKMRFGSRKTQLKEGMSCSLSVWLIFCSKSSWVCHLHQSARVFCH